MNAEEIKQTEEFIHDSSPEEMTQPHPGEFPEQVERGDTDAREIG